MFKEKSESVPKKMRPIYDKITALTDEVCRKHLNEEYAVLARNLTSALARKRPSPLERGKIDVWACSIVYALGRVNFLFDKNQTIHLTADELAGLFGVSQKTASNKARQIMEIFNIVPLDPEWTLPSKMDDNPFAWMVLINGLMVDARHLPLEVQEQLVQMGVIPYVHNKKLEALENDSGDSGGSSGEI
jgi:hypothetical protein